ncbi:MAG: histidinol dehydrogenase [Candidatus Saganbacteria bacterium]|nr:histidinol dehydrogenase [Candidatus Saganbacteria bacterium]
MKKEEAAVKKIIADVELTGDKALVKYAKKFDKVSLLPEDFRVTAGEIDEAYKNAGREFLSAIKTAEKNIRAYHEKQKPSQWFETTADDAILGLRSIPLESAGIYVPGGRAAYPSSVLMNAIPARIAGVKRIAMVTPCGKDKKINIHVLAAAKLMGISEIYRIGGAHAIAALAFGTKSIPKVDKIVGPGNIYVTLAKKLLYGTVGIDKLAGPSDVVIIADGSADVRFVAADMASQIEHDPMSSAVLITLSKETERDVKHQLKKLGAVKGSKFIIAKDLDEAARFSNKIAPEHLELMVAVPQKLLEKIKNAGAVFLGPFSPVAVGDYIAGPNHVLPTGGSARFSSPLSAGDFVKQQSVIGYTKSALSRARKDIKVLAGVEGLKAHAASVEIRFK